MGKTFFGEDVNNLAEKLRADFRSSPNRIAEVQLNKLMEPMVGH